MVGVKEYKKKTRFSLLPFEALEPVARVLEYGATTKYAMDNWKHVEHKGPYVDGIIRHWVDYILGEEIDKQTNENHLASIVCNALFLIWDRQKKQNVPFEEYIKQLLTYEDYLKEVDAYKFEKE